MRILQAREAKAGFSAMIEAAERGEPTTITRHGRPSAVLVPVEDARRLYPDTSEDFAAHLLAFTGGVDLDRDETPMRPVEF